MPLSPDREAWVVPLALALMLLLLGIGYATMVPSSANTDGRVLAVVETPTLYIRYVYKDGRYVLQQQWAVREADGDIVREWRDVPTADQTEP